LTSQELLEANAELSRSNVDLEIRVAARTAELSSSEARFRGLFEHAPISLWEEDFSAVRQYIDDLRAAGVGDFSAYFDAHPEAVSESAALVKIVDVNRATLKMYQAESKAQLLADLSKVLGPESLIPFKEELLVLVRGETSFENETINYTLRGERRVVFIRLTVAPGSEQTWVKVFVGISDITERRQAEAELALEHDLLQALMDNIPDTIYFKDTDSRFTRINRAQVNVLGIAAPKDAIGKTDLDFQDSELARSFFEEEQRVIATGESLINRMEFNPTPDGKPRWFSATKVPIKDPNGHVIGIVGISRDITERNQVEESLRQSEERFRLMAWATQDAVWDWDLQTRQISWGEGLQKIFRYSSETLETDSEWWRDRIHPDDSAKVDHVINQALDGGMEFWSKEYRFQRVDGTYADIMDRAYIMRDVAGKAYRMIGAMMDITERKQMESTLLQSNEKLGRLLEELQQHSRETALLNELSHLLQGCQSAQEAYGTIAELSKQFFPHTAGALYLLNATRTQVSTIATWGEFPSTRQMFAPADCRALRRSPTRPLNEDQRGSCCLHSAQPPAITYCLPIHLHGEIIGIFHLQSTSEENLPENKRQLAYTVIEQSELALSNLKLREALLEQSIRDPLTELYNRRYMEEALNQQLSRVTRQLHPLGLIMIDIDHFKNFNDTHGHAAGDALLRELGRLLQSHIRGGDVACRYGGEEFLLIMPDASLEAAHQRAVLLQQEAKKLRVQDAGQSLDGITLSLGVAIYPEHGRSIDSVLRAADAALYRAKQEGRDRVVVAESSY
jgi:diguanylate cyclase (GGDEF)-like protein/PAS domain S-box-containing protein